MKLLSIENSNLIVLGLASRERNQIYLPHLLSSFIRRYQFLSFPDEIASATPNKYEFSQGIFEDGAIETFIVYTDGIVVHSKSNSEFLDRFIKDVMAFLRDEWDTHFVESNTTSRMYQSTLIIESDKDILKPLSEAQVLAERIKEKLSTATGLNVEFEQFGMIFSADCAKIPMLRPAPFRIERRAGTEFSFNQYFTSAPLTTDDHLDILQAWESLV